MCNTGAGDIAIFLNSKGLGLVMLCNVLTSRSSMSITVVASLISVFSVLTLVFMFSSLVYIRIEGQY